MEGPDNYRGLRVPMLVLDVCACARFGLLAQCGRCSLATIGLMGWFWVTIE